MLKEKLARHSVIISLVTAAAISACFYTVFNDWPARIFFAAFIGAFLAAVIIALPIYLKISLKEKLSWHSPVIYGFLTGAIPSGIFPLPSMMDGKADLTSFVHYFAGGGLLGVAGAIPAWIVWMYLKGYLGKEKP